MSQSSFTEYSKEANEIANAVFEEAIKKGKSHEDSLFQARLQALRYENKIQLEKEAKKKPKTVPSHLSAVLNLLNSVENSSIDEINKNSLPLIDDTPNQSQNSSIGNSVQDIYVEGEYLVIRYSSGNRKKVPVISITQNIAVKQDTSGAVSTNKSLEPMTILNSNSEPELLFTTDGEIISSVITIDE